MPDLPPHALVAAFNECINAGDLDGLAGRMSDDHLFVDSAGTELVASLGCASAACMPFWRRGPPAPRAFLVAATAIAVGCRAEVDSLAWTVSADTVGAAIHVINTPPRSGAPATLVATEELRVGEVEGEGPASFGLIRAVAVLDDGRFAVADGQAEEVRLFDPEGRHLRTFGGEGAGPGELGGMQGVHVDHRGLLRVAEQANARLSVFHPDTGFAGSIPLRIHSYGFRGPWAAAVDSAGRTFVDSSGQFGPGRFWSMLRVYDASMTQIDSLPYYDYTDDVERDDFPGAWRIPVGDRGWMYASVPFYAGPEQVLSSSGYFWSSIEGETQLRVARWFPPGDTTLVVSSRRQPDPVTAQERDSAMAELVERLAEQTSSVPTLDPSRVPSTKPPLYGLSLDDRERLWVRLTDPSLDSTLYDVFDPDGAYAETVSVPFRVDAWVPPVVRGDAMWAVATDALEVQYVVRARIREAAAVDGGSR